MAEEEAGEYYCLVDYQQQYEQEEVLFYLEPSNTSDTVVVDLQDDTSVNNMARVTSSNTSNVNLTGEAATAVPAVNRGMTSPGRPITCTNTASHITEKADENRGHEEDSEIKFIDDDVDSINDTDLSDAAQDSTLEITNQDIKPTNDEIFSRFAKLENSFREKFLSPSVLDLSIQKEEVIAKMGSLPQAQLTMDLSGATNHLDKILKILQQLTYLRNQNEQLQKKCSFLEDTRYLLQVQNDMIMAKDSSKSKTWLKQSQKVMNFFDAATNSFHVDTSTPVRNKRERFPSEGSDSELYRDSMCSVTKGAKIQRSQSDGSLELVDLDFTTSFQQVSQELSTEKTPTRDYFPSRSDFHKKSRKLQQKWEQVKKVFSSKPEHVPKTDTGAVSAEQLVKANTKTVDRPKPLNIPTTSDDLLLSPVYRLPSNYDVVPPSPNSINSEPSNMQADGGVVSDAEDSLDICGVSIRKRSHSADSATSGGKGKHFIFDDPSLSDSERTSDRMRYLRLEGRLERRRSSPTLSLHDGDKDYIDLSGSQSRMGRSSSVKLVKSNSDLDVASRHHTRKAHANDAAKKAKAAWGRVKDIIHTRKDSLKKNKNRHSHGHAMSDGEISPDHASGGQHMFQIGESDVRPSRVRSKNIRSYSPTSSSPLRARSRRLPPGGSSASPSRKQKRKSLAHVVLSGNNSDVASLMSSGISDDFTRRMQEWELKKKRGLIKANSFSCEMDPPKGVDTTFSEDFIKKMEEWEQIKGHKGIVSPPKSPGPEESVVVEAGSPAEQSTTTSLQHLSKSFTKTVQEWERLKERRAREGTSPGPEPRGRQRQVERSKSHERDRSRHKYEKEIQKIERKEWKIEREKQKLERMKMKLDMALESSSGSEGFGDSLTLELLKKQLHDHDVTRSIMSQQLTEKKMMSTQHYSESTIITDGEPNTLNMRSVSTKDFSESKSSQRERILSESCIQSLPQRSLSYEPQLLADTPYNRVMSTLAEPIRVIRGKSSETDDSTALHGASSSGEGSGALRQLLDEKEETVRDLQYDIQQLTDRISFMDRDHHQKIESYKRQLRAANRMGQYACQTYQIDASLRELRDQVDILIQAQDILVNDKHMLQKRLHSQMEEHELSKTELLGQIRVLQEKLDQQQMNRGMDPPHETVTALCGLITQAHDQLKKQQELLSGHTDRIKVLERHLLIQRVNNKLLEAGLQRQSLEIHHLRDQKQKRVIKRSKTFSGYEFSIRQGGKLETSANGKLTDPSGLCSLSKKLLPPLSTDTTSGIPIDIPSDWLRSIQKQLEGSSQQTKTMVKKPEHKNTVSQTVMTLCNCPYTPPGADPVEESLKSTENAKYDGKKNSSENHASMSTIATQTGPDIPPESSRQSAAVIVATQTGPDIPPESSRQSAAVIVANVSDVAIPNITVSVTSVKPASKSSLDTKFQALAAKFENMKSQETKRHSYQELVKREQDPASLVPRSQSLDVPNEPNPPNYDKVFEAEGNSLMKENETCSPVSVKCPQLPHSPVIRSKNVRKLRNAAATVSADARTWKATPPRRFIRHRKNLVERLSMGGVLSDEETRLAEEVENSRKRTKSDSSQLIAACMVARENSFKRQNGSGSEENFIGRKKIMEGESYVSRHTARSSSGVRDMISRYEDGNFRRGYHFRKSPSPSMPRFSVTATRRLKTAAELLQDSIEQKQNRSRSTPRPDYQVSAASRTRDELSSTSSDKENSSHRSFTIGTFHHHSESRSPERDLQKVEGYDVGASNQSVMVDNQEQLKPLKDLTNDKFESRSMQMDQQGSDRPCHEDRNKNTLSSISSESTITGNHSRPTTSRSTRTVTKHESLESHKSIYKGDSVDSQSTWSCMSSDHDDSCPETCGSPWHMAKPRKSLSEYPPKSPGTDSDGGTQSKTKRRFWSKEPKEQRSKSKSGHRFFDKKRAPSPSPARGAISALCMQTMTLSVDDDSTDSSAGAFESIPQSPKSDPGDKRSRRSKFLESSWFQKPKGLFKVSKC